MDLKAELLKRVDLRGLVLDVGVKFALDYLQEKAKETDNALDDLALAAMRPLVEKYVGEQLDTQLAKLSE